MKRIIPLVSLAFVWGCSGRTASEDAVSDSLSRPWQAEGEGARTIHTPRTLDANDQICFAILLHETSQCGRMAAQIAATDPNSDADVNEIYFISPAGMRAPADVMLALKKAAPERTFKWSDAANEPFLGSEVTDKRTGQRGRLFRVGSIRRISETEYEGEGGWYKHGLAARQTYYRLVRRNEDTWFIEETRTLWIS